MKKLIAVVAGCLVAGLVFACTTTPSSGVSNAPRTSDSHASEHSSPNASQAPNNAPTVAAPSHAVASVSASAVARTPCPTDMVLSGKTCVDRYEAPNQKGANPLVMQSALDAEAWCSAKGKRLCSETEWNRACEGPNGNPVPYGKQYKSGVCNDDKKWTNPGWGKLAKWPAPEASAEAARLYQAEPSGQRPECVSEEGVFDMTGNVAEWVKRTLPNETNYPHVVKGCYWGRCFRPPYNPTCDYVNYKHQSADRSYEFGFRCCADPNR